MIILARMLILSEYPNDKRRFILFTSITDLLSNYQHMGLCPTWNKDKSATSTGESNCIHLPDPKIGNC